MNNGEATCNPTLSPTLRGGGNSNGQHQVSVVDYKPCGFQVPLHYPRYTKSDYEKMPEWQLDRLFNEYGLPAAAAGDVDQKRRFAMGAFLWPDQY